MHKKIQKKKKKKGGGFLAGDLPMSTSRRTPGERPKNTRVGGGWWVGGWVRTTPGEGPTGVGRTATWHM
jgi:hypothetical protein